MQEMTVKGKKIKILRSELGDFVCISDIARHKDSERTDYIVQNWLRLRSTIEFLGIWEKLNNPIFNSIEFDGFRNLSGENSFFLTPKRWIERTGSVGLISKQGRYGGTYAHEDIAFEFASWISPSFKLFIIREFSLYLLITEDSLFLYSFFLKII